MVCGCRQERQISLGFEIIVLWQQAGFPLQTFNFQLDGQSPGDFMSAEDTHEPFICCVFALLFLND